MDAAETSDGTTAALGDGEMRTRSGRLFGAGPGAGDADDLQGESGVGDTLRTTADQTVKMQEARTQLEQEIARMEETERRHAEALRRLEESQARRERLSRLLAEPAVTPASVRASDRPVREVSWGGADPLCTAAPQHGPVRHRWSARSQPDGRRGIDGGSALPIPSPVYKTACFGRVSDRTDVAPV